jgi:dephospho-CoA kinase
MSGARPKLVGITGGIGSGKSLVVRIFSHLGVPAYDADSRAKALMQHNPTLKAKIIALFGEASYPDGQLDRAFIASKAFHQPDLLQQLNAAVHPEVAKDFAQWVSEKSHHPYLLKEAALLFEAGSYQVLDSIILVTAPVEVRVARVLERDPQRSREEVLAIIDKQWPDDQKIPLAHHVIVNDGQTAILPQVLALHQQFMS